MPLAPPLILLCATRKSLDADHLQNFLYDALAGIDADKLAAELLKAGKEKVFTPTHGIACGSWWVSQRGHTLRTDENKTNDDDRNQE